jgi:hypothetical protein
MGPWPQDEDPYAGLDDNAVIARAQEIYARLQSVPRWHADNDRLIREWGGICREMGRRGITDTVTEGEASGATVTRLITG